MNKDEKTAVIGQIASQISESEAIFAVDYRGISVAQVAELRAKLREADAAFRVVKNTLTERAADQAGAETLKPMLVGPTAFAFVKGDAALAAKVLATFARLNDLLEFKGGLMSGNPLDAEEIKSIARLPARDVLNAQFVGVLASPITGLVRGLGSLISGLAIQLKQIEEQGLVGGEAPVEEAPAAEEVSQAPEAEETPEAEENSTEQQEEE